MAAGQGIVETADLLLRLTVLLLRDPGTLMSRLSFCLRLKSLLTYFVHSPPLLLLVPGEAARKAKLKLARMARLARAVDGPSAGGSGRWGGGGGGGGGGVGNGLLLDERLLLNPDDDGYDEDDEDDDEDDDPSLGGTGMDIWGQSKSVGRWVLLGGMQGPWWHGPPLVDTICICPPPHIIFVPMRLRAVWGSVQGRCGAVPAMAWRRCTGRLGRRSLRCRGLSV